MMRSKKIRIKHLRVTTLFILFLFVVIAFLSNRTLIFFFKDKIWAHKVNSIEKLVEANKLLSGVELDVVFYAKANYFDVNHPPDKSLNLSLAEYFQFPINNSNYKYWIDFKNLNEDNELQSLVRLDSITNVFNINKSNVIVESVSPQFLKSFQDKGFLTSCYLPSRLHALNEDSLKVVIELINKDLITYESFYISMDYKDYHIVKKHFPDKKKLCWFTTYGLMNKITARILLYEILLDDDVDVLLIPF